MRMPIAIQVKPFDIETVQPHIDAARAAFGRYLEEAKLRSTGSMHGLMGPVGKVLSEVKSGRRDPASLKGYAVRVHEMIRRNPSQAALEALEQGIDGLVKLLDDYAPVTAHDRVLDRLKFGLFYDLRKKALESRERVRRAWIGFLREKYTTANQLSEAWGERVSAFEDIRLFRKSEGSKSKKATAKQRDIIAFWEPQGAIPFDTDEEE